MSIKGYPSSLKEDRTKSEHVNIKQVSPNEFALMSYNIGSAYVVASDLTEAGTDDNTIVATGHGARVGDLIRLTSGVYSGYETRVIDVIDANTISIDQKFATAIGVGDGFDLLRNITQTVSSGGGLSISIPDDANYGVVGGNTLRTAAQIGNATGAAAFGSGAYNAQTLRTTPATDSAHLLNVRHEAAATPLAAQLSDGSAFYQGAIEPTQLLIKAKTDNIDVALSTRATEATLATRATEATLATRASETTLASRASEATLATRATESSLNNLNLKVNQNFGSVGTGVRTCAQIGNGLGAANFDTGVVGAQTLRTTPATNSEHLLNVRHEAAGTPLAVRITDGTAFESGKVKGYDSADTYFRDYASSSLTAATWTEIIASTAAEAQEIEIFDSSGEVLELGFGAAASEVRQMYITPGGNGRVKLNIPASTRLSVKSVPAVNVGNLVVNLYG